MEAKIFNVSGWIKNTTPDDIKTYYNKLLEKSNFKILNFQEHFFEPEGYTALWLLGESHFAIHTFPEENKTYFELSSCNLDYYNIFKKEMFNIDGGEAI